MAETMNRCQYCKWWTEGPKFRVGIRPCTYGKWADVQDMPLNGMAILCGHDGPIFTGADFGCVNFEARQAEPCAQ